MVAIDPTPAKPRTRPKDRREQILREAYRLIAASGFNAVSLSEIAEACGIRKSSVLHHFPSMNDLLLAVLQMREDQDFEYYRDSPHTEEPGPAGARETFTRVFHHNLDRPEFVRLYAILSGEALAPDHPAHDYFAMRTRGAQEELARSLDWKPDPHAAAAELLAFWSGLELAWQHDPELDVRAVWENFSDRFFA